MIFGNFLVSFWSRFGPPAATMRPERAPRRAKMGPKMSQGGPKWPPGDKHWNLSDFLIFSGLILGPFWDQIRGKNAWIFDAVIDAEKTTDYMQKNDIKHVIKNMFLSDKYNDLYTSILCENRWIPAGIQCFPMISISLKLKETWKISFKISTRKCVRKNINT